MRIVFINVGEGISELGCYVAPKDTTRDALAIQRCYITSLDLSTRFVATYLWYNPYSQYLPDSRL